MTEETEAPSLVAFVRAQLDETERIALATCTLRTYESGSEIDVELDGEWDAIGEGSVSGSEIWVDAHGDNGENHAKHIALHDPVAVLASVAADRAVLDLHASFNAGYDVVCETCSNPLTSLGTEVGPLPAPCPTVRALAQKFAGRPRWRDEWTVKP